MRAWLSIYLKGVFMGAADALPGVSGGTIALITGIYERLITAIAAFDPRIVTSILQSYNSDERTKVRKMLVSMDVAFLLVLGAGIATAIVAVTRLVLIAKNAAPGPMYAFFFGLIGASAIVLYGEVSVDTPGRIAAAIVGFWIAFLTAGVSAGGGLGHGPLFVFVSGAIAITAMVLPGISGALILILLGQYTFMSETLHAFLGALTDAATGGDVSTVITTGSTVVLFLLGAGIGLVTVSHLVSWALDHYRAATLTFLVSLMVGALRYPIEEVLGTTTGWTPTSVGAVLLATLAGGGAVLLIDRYTDDLDY